MFEALVVQKSAVAGDAIVSSEAWVERFSSMEILLVMVLQNLDLPLS